MARKQAVLFASGDPSILAQLRVRIDDIEVVGCHNDLPSLIDDVHYWCFVDWLLPDMSGIEMCRRLRETPATRFAHITMMLNNDNSDLKTRALLSGADDYLLGPANVDRLAVRLQRYRRSKAKPAPSVTLRSSDLQVDLGAMRVRHRDKRISLAPNEFHLLAHFMGNPDRVFSRASLIGILGKDDAGIDERTVDVWVGRLRRALKAQGVPDMLRTVRAMGYVFDGS